MASRNDETQLSFIVTKFWDRPEGESGFTEMTCSQASFLRVLEWMLEEIPAGYMRRSGSAVTIEIDLGKLPEGIAAPSIGPRPVPDTAAELGRASAVIARVRDRLERSTGMVNANQVLDLLDPEGMWSYSFTTEVPEPWEPS
jgi:hypothetical protein